MKTKLKPLTTLNKIIYLLYGIAVVLFIASVMPTLVYFNFRGDFVIAYAVRFTPYLALGATAVFSNKYNVRRLVTLNLIYLAVCFLISAVTDFRIIFINANDFTEIDTILYYTVMIFVTLFLGGIASHCSNFWIYGYGFAMSMISIISAIMIYLEYNKFMLQIWLISFSIAAYFFTLIAVAERFSEDNKYTNLCDKIFGGIEDELDKKSDENEYYIHGAFKIMMAESIADENENLSRYCDFYETLKNSDFTAMEEKGFLKKEFITEFCNFVSAYLDKETTTEQETVFNNIAKILANEDTDDNTYRKEILNLYCLISRDFVVDPTNCADRIYISHNADNEAEALSIFAEQPFELDGIQINSIESFLQSLKYKGNKKQQKICCKFSLAARINSGRNNLWKWNGGKLYWQGEEINRFSDEYQQLLTRAFIAMLESNNNFKNALMSTVDEFGVQKLITYPALKENPQDTLLTVNEFTDRLYGIRKYLMNPNN